MSRKEFQEWSLAAGVLFGLGAAVCWFAGEWGIGKVALGLSVFGMVSWWATKYGVGNDHREPWDGPPP